MKERVHAICMKIVERAGEVANKLSDRTGIRLVSESLPHPQRAGCKTLGIPGYRQCQTYTCGFVTAANVVHWFRSEADLSVLYDGLDNPEGTSEPEVARALRAYGIGVRRRTTLDFRSLSKALRCGCPVIASVDSRTGGHWVVIYGYDNNQRTVFVCGSSFLPGLGKKEIPFATFRQGWNPPGNGLVCSARQLPQRGRVCERPVSKVIRRVSIPT